MIVYKTVAGDMVDEICHKYYGTTAGRVTEMVYAANQGLADRGVRLPAGIDIILPAVTTSKTEQEVRLWD